ncbi:MAG: NAD-dependent epimerase/dehydratase family protein [Gemmatimonadota bacterium]|nr:MAG: NAD-dependent epimerase/dehydratase family protein [Gemmatimonadota bacterium]
MNNSRREFVRTTASGVLSAGLLGSKGYAAQRGTARDRSVPRAQASLRILILGGTGFTGPFQIEYALARGHQVTIFNRGRTQPTVNADLLERVERLVGDRDNDIEALRGGQWDAVIDNSSSVPRWTRQTAELLKDTAHTYLFTSSLSVHSDNSKIGINEDDPVIELEDPTVEEVTGATYGGLKALCEEETRRIFPDGAIIVRPGLIVGPGDRSDRWTYWPVRIARGGEVMAPGTPDDPTQHIDARDLAEFDIHLIEQRKVGTYSAVGPLSQLSMAELLYGIRAIVSNEISFTWVDADFLAEHEVSAWSEMTSWVPPRGEMAGFSSFDNSRAVAAGLKFRPLALTAKDTLDWWWSLPEERGAQPRAGLDPEKERRVLEAFHEAHG